MMRLRDNRKPVDFYKEETGDVVTTTMTIKLKCAKLYGVTEARFRVLRRRNFAKRQCCRDDLYKMKQRVNIIVDYSMRNDVGLLNAAMKGMKPVMNRRTCACCNFYSCALKCFGTPAGIYFYCVNRIMKNIHMCRLKFSRLYNLFAVESFKKFTVDEYQFVVDNIKIVSKKMLDMNTDKKFRIVPSTTMYSLYLTRIFQRIMINNYLDEPHMMQLSQFFVDTNCIYGMYVMSVYNEQTNPKRVFLCKEEHVTKYKDAMYEVFNQTDRALAIVIWRHYKYNRSRFVKCNNLYQTINV